MTSSSEESGSLGIRSSIGRSAASLDALLPGRLLPAEAARGGTKASPVVRLGTAAAPTLATEVAVDMQVGVAGTPPSRREACLAGGGSGLLPGPLLDGVLPARRMAPGGMRLGMARSSQPLLLRGSDELAQRMLVLTDVGVTDPAAFIGLATLTAELGRLP